MQIFGGFVDLEDTSSLSVVQVRNFGFHVFNRKCLLICRSVLIFFLFQGLRLNFIYVLENFSDHIIKVLHLQVKLATKLSCGLVALLV